MKISANIAQQWLKLLVMDVLVLLRNDVQHSDRMKSQISVKRKGLDVVVFLKLYLGHQVHFDLEHFFFTCCENFQVPQH